MSLRETLDKNRTAVTVGAVALVVFAIGFIIWQAASGGPPGPQGLASKYYFTTDDGATYFADSSSNIPPYKKDGKDAVRAYVFTCDGGKTKFVGYLEQFNARVKPQLEKLYADGNPDPVEIDRIGYAGAMVKAPRNPKAQWIPRTATVSGMVMEPKCADGTINNRELVMP